MLSFFFDAFMQMLTFQNMLIIFLGVGVGIIFGALPGLTATMAVALCLPFSFGMGPISGFALLIALYIGGISGGLISAILINIPGTPSSVATTFDGAPMARNGEGGKALGTGVVFSFFGTIFSIAILIFVAPPLAEFALKFGPYEYFALAFFFPHLHFRPVRQIASAGLRQRVHRNGAGDRRGRPDQRLSPLYLRRQSAHERL